MGASKWVPVCSPVVKLFQYQAGPRSSYLLISCRVSGIVFPNGSGSLISGVSALSGAVRSITSMVLKRSAATRASRTGMCYLLRHGSLGESFQACRSRLQQGRSRRKQDKLASIISTVQRRRRAVAAVCRERVGRSAMRSVTGAGVVVTGAGSGIGAALARRFAAEGARVVLNDLNAEAVKAVAASCDPAAGNRALAFSGDAASEEGVAALIDAARDELGEIDLYCANAGIARIGGPEATEGDFADCWKVNVMAHVRAAGVLLAAWLGRGSGQLMCTVSAA